MVCPRGPRPHDGYGRREASNMAVSRRWATRGSHVRVTYVHGCCEAMAWQVHGGGGLPGSHQPCPPTEYPTRRRPREVCLSLYPVKQGSNGHGISGSATAPIRV